MRDHPNAVLVRRCYDAFAAGGKDLGDTLPDKHPIPPHDHIGPLLDRDRALGILAHGQARHAERRGLFLDPSRIGDD